MFMKEPVTTRLRRLRKRAGLTMAELTKQLGMKSISTYQRYESDNLYTKDYFSIELAYRLLKVLEGKGEPPITEDEILSLAGVGWKQEGDTRYFFGKEIRESPKTLGLIKNSKLDFDISGRMLFLASAIVSSWLEYEDIALDNKLFLEACVFMHHQIVVDPDTIITLILQLNADNMDGFDNLFQALRAWIATRRASVTVGSSAT